jgi:hypothetical protein
MARRLAVVIVTIVALALGAVGVELWRCQRDRFPVMVDSAILSSPGQMRHAFGIPTREGVVKARDVFGKAVEGVTVPLTAGVLPDDSVHFLMWERRCFLSGLQRIVAVESVDRERLLFVGGITRGGSLPIGLR